MTDAGMSSAILVEPSGRTRRLHVHVHSGMKEIFCLMTQILMMMRMKTTLMKMIITLTRTQNGNNYLVYYGKDDLNDIETSHSVVTFLRAIWL